MSKGRLIASGILIAVLIVLVAWWYWPRKPVMTLPELMAGGDVEKVRAYFDKHPDELNSVMKFSTGQEVPSAFTPLDHLCQLINRVVSVLLVDVSQKIRFGGAVAGVVIAVTRAVERCRTALMQNAQQPRQRIVAVTGVHAIRTTQRRPPSQAIVAKRELAGGRVGDAGELVQSVVSIGVGAAVRRGE